MRFRSAVLLAILIGIVCVSPVIGQAVLAPPTTSQQFAWTFDGQNAARLEVKLKDADPWVVLPLTARTYPLPALSDGPYLASVRACTAAGVCSAAVSIGFTVQTPQPAPNPPTAPRIEPVPVKPPPTGSNRCPPFPSFPDETCTGTLPTIARTASGSIATSSAGQVIQNLNIVGKITVNHSNVIVRNVRITKPNGVAISNINCPTCTGLVIEDSELDGTGNTTAASAVDMKDYKIYRSRIHHFAEGPGAGSEVYMEESHISTFLNFVAGGAHQDGFQAEYGSRVTLRHNTILADVDGMNSAITIGNQPGNDGNLVEQNLLSGGSFAVTFGGQGILRNNRFSTTMQPNGGYYGPYSVTGGVSKCGNTWQDGPNAGKLITGEAACQ